MKIKILSSFLALAILFSGCASIIHGRFETVDFTSQPTGAKITIDGKDYGTTPKSISLNRNGRLKGEPTGKQSYSVKIELEGYYPYEIKIKRGLDGWFLGNVIFGGLLGIIIDSATGSMYKLSPDQVIATLGKETAISKNDNNIFIAVTLNPDPSWEKIGELTEK